MSSNYAFLSYVRQGLASRIPTGAVAGYDARVRLPVTLTLEGASSGSVDVALLGPGDVTGIDSRVVIRTEPPNLSRSLEPNYFPFVELDRPDFPWLFSPKGPQGTDGDRLLPWLCLVVVPQAEATLDTSGSNPLPVLTVDPIELPRLEQSWAWVHVQIAGYEAGESVRDIIADAPERVCSRLICPRKLEANTAYYACLVPTFEAGRKAGLPGQDPDGTEADAFAWSTPDTAGTQVELPVYYAYEFSTGQAGDFESLVRALEPRTMPSNVGRKNLDISDPGSDVGPLAASHPMAVVGLVSALRAVETDPDQTIVDSDSTYSTYVTALRSLLNEGAALGSNVVTPPIYGRWHGLVLSPPTVPWGKSPVELPPIDGDPPGWLRQLNLSPWHRAAAGLGARVIEENQRALMASAWDQAGDLTAANQAKRHMGFAARIGRAKHRRWFRNADWQKLLQLVGPASSRLVPSGSTKSVRAQIETTKFPVAAFGTAMRKVARARGPLARRFDRVRGTSSGFSSVCEKIRSELAKPAGERPPVAGMVDLGAVADDFVNHAGNTYGASPLLFSGLRSSLGALLKQGFDPAEDIRRTRNEPDARGSWTATVPPVLAVGAFLRAAVPHQMQLVHLTEHLKRAAESRDQLPTEGSGAVTAASLQSAISGLRPETLTQNRLARRLGTLHQGYHSSSQRPFARTLIGPTFPQPMYEPLRALNPEFLLAGAGDIPTNTVGLLQTNRAFIEAYMVGLNHAMSGEFLWQEYPTDLRATYFSQFWDASDADGDSDPDDDPPADISPINTWTSGSKLGEHDPSSTGRGITDGSDGSGAKVVLLIRGELLQRYPRTTIYAAKAVAKPGLGTRERTLTTNPEEHLYPIFRATLGEDITCIGFDLTVSEALGTSGDPQGWFFVLEEQPTEPRFGMDALNTKAAAYGEEATADLTTEGGSWGDLAWGAVVNSSDEYDALRHVDLDQSDGLNPNAGPYYGLVVGSVRWGKNSASMANITYQQPFRVAIHADDLIT